MAGGSETGDSSDHVPNTPVPKVSSGEGQVSREESDREVQRALHSDKAYARNPLLDNMKPENCTSMPENATENAHPYVSFGDDGTTASLNSYGELIQISQFHESSRSGFFSVDLPEVEEPYLVQDRAETLLDIRDTEEGGICAFLTDLPEALLWGGTARKIEFVHNRWPLFTEKYDDQVTFRTLHVAFENTIFQQYQWSTDADPLIFTSGVEIEMPVDLLIRDLEFVDESYAFNEDKFGNSEDTEYSIRLCKSQYGFMLNHAGIPQDYKAPQEKGHTESALLAVSIFVNGKAQQLRLDERRRRLLNQPPKTSFTLDSKKPLQITVAYKLVVYEEAWEDAEPLITEESLGAMHKMLETSQFTKPKFSDDGRINFVMSRNLEHILSVCSIPVPPRGSKGCEYPNPKKEAIALTCGDMSGHRIVTSASFFAFQFLLSIHDRLNGEESLSGLKERIKNVCRGHTIWLKEADKIKRSRYSGVQKGGREAVECFDTSYWVTGEAISRRHPTVAPSTPPLTDTPFQLIKLAEFGHKFMRNKKDGSVDDENLEDKFMRNKKDDSVDEEYLEDFKTLAKDWILGLDDANLREFYVFPRPKSAGTTLQNVRLDDHVWIWRALESITKVGLDSILDNRKRPKSRRDPPSKTTPDAPNLDYFPKVFQRHALRRFTTENPVSKQRMLAVARSPSDNRFYLHSRDTALLYEEHSSFFFQSDALLEATLSVQKYHEEFEDTRWDDPLRYALAIMLGDRICGINDLSKGAEDILLRSCATNGLFPGALDPVTKEPELGEMWGDKYWHSTFEVPYILLQRTKPKLIHPLRQESKTNPSQRTVEQPVDELASAATKSGSSLPSHPESRTALVQRTGDRPVNSQASDPSSNQLEMKIRIPFNNVILHQSIVELSDEWLYKMPSFFEKGKEVKMYKTPGVGAKSRGIVINIPKTSRNNKGKRQQIDDKAQAERNESLCNQGIYERLRPVRTAQSSKKRLIWISEPGEATEETLCNTSSSTEMESLHLFFDRHRTKIKYFSDEVTSTANLWTTELHLSSYRICQQNKDNELTGITFLGSKDLSIEKVGAGFLFVGDFFDRYWTCYVLETGLDDQITIAENLFHILEPEKLRYTYEPPKKPWKQRKVLELLLLDRTLAEITKRYKAMVDATGEQLKQLTADAAHRNYEADTNIVTVANELFSSQMNNDAYLRFRQHWPSFQYSLQIMEIDLIDTLDKIDAWLRRKAERKPAEPRWTKNDERSYRAAITKLTGENRRAIQELENHLAVIHSLRESVSSGLQSTRDELNYLSAENIRHFTYITVVFLPLGFATGIFSMADSSPRGENLKGMAITAVVTLFVTVMVLANVQNVNKKLVRSAVSGSHSIWKRRKGALNEPSNMSRCSSIPAATEHPPRPGARVPSSGISQTRNATSSAQTQPNEQPGSYGRLAGPFVMGQNRTENQQRSIKEEGEMGPDDPRLEEGLRSNGDKN